MTKRLTAALLCAAVSFLLFGAATAEARVLSVRTAKSLARALAEKQVRGRDVVSFHIGKAKRVGARRIVFPYDDRTASHVFCTARLVVSIASQGRTTKIRARFIGQRCAGIPSEVLKFEALTRRAQRELRTDTSETVDALVRVLYAEQRCRSVAVPRANLRDARALFDIALVEAVERPNDAAFGRFADRLLNVHAGSATLAAGAAAWADYVAALRAMPTVTGPCAALKAWKRAGFAAGSAPIDFAAYRRLARRASSDSSAITRAARLMARRGAFRSAAESFTTSGMLLDLAARAGVASAHKVVAKALP